MSPRIAEGQSLSFYGESKESVSLKESVIQSPNCLVFFQVSVLYSPSKNTKKKSIAEEAALHWQKMFGKYSFFNKYINI